ncbi:MAG: AAA family ATPase [Betaproteobacteria bacterium]|nr:AAA family ATPase [Betaproteobacteria bacterium]
MKAELPAAEAAQQKAAAEVRTAETEMSAAEQAQGVEETRESHALKLLAQLEARKNRLKQENMALVFPEPEKLAALAGEARDPRRAPGTPRSAPARPRRELPALEDERLAIRTRCRSAPASSRSSRRRSRHSQAQQAKLDNNSRLADWTKAHALDRAERLWQAIHVEAGWDDAVEAALGVRLNAARLGEEGDLAELLRDAPPGNFAVFVERGAAEAAASASHLTPLSSVVSSARPGVAAYLRDALSGVFILPEGEDGLALARVLPPGGLLVSKAGHLFSRQGVVFHGPQSELHGVLQRQREIEDLQARTPGVAAARAAVEARLRELETLLTEAQDEGRRVREELSRARQAGHDLEVEHVKLSQSTEQATKRREAIRAELADIEREEEKERLEMQEAQHAPRGRLAEDRGRGAAPAGPGAGAAKRAGEALARRAARSHPPSGRCRKRGSTRAAATRRSSRRAGSPCPGRARGGARRQPRERQAELGQLEEGTVREPPAGRPRGEGGARARAGRRPRRARAHHRGTALARGGPPGGRAGAGALRERITELRIKEQEAATHAEQYAQQIQEAGVTREELAEKLEKRVRSSGMQAEIARLGEEIAALGAVNLAALSELTTARERKDFLDAQSADLTQAVETLEAAIKRIDRETRELLQGTFEAVNRNFQEMFPALFGGGQAYLKLTGEEILDAGLQVFAQPPGKKNTSIQLLSGGEKALTAIALVFSLFRLNPAPFCLLDEVDAPLDDPNTERFCELVKQMSAQTQFLFITHNKITMEMGQQLIGVTMQEPGVSRIVEVDIEAAMEFARKQAA